jgi:hypothetical protein
MLFVMFAVALAVYVSAARHTGGGAKGAPAMQVAGF